MLAGRESSRSCGFKDGISSCQGGRKWIFGGFSTTSRPHTLSSEVAFPACASVRPPAPIPVRALSSGRDDTNEASQSPLKSPSRIPHDAQRPTQPPHLSSPARHTLPRSRLHKDHNTQGLAQAVYGS